MKRLILSVCLLAAWPVHAQERRESDLLLRRGDRFEAPSLPRDRYDVGRDTGSRYRGVYDSQGRRTGTIERNPYGGYTYRDNQGRRR